MLMNTYLYGTKLKAKVKIKDDLLLTEVKLITQAKINITLI